MQGSIGKIDAVQFGDILILTLEQENLVKDVQLFAGQIVFSKS